MKIRPSRWQGNNQYGASLVEFSIVAPLLFIMGLGTLQAGLLYHNKTILNYATYEAARVGATQHAEPSPMRRELGIRLAPIVGGDGSFEKAIIAMGRTSLQVDSPVRTTGAMTVPTKLEILNPSVEAFSHWGENSLEFVNQRAIPNSHLRHQSDDVRGGITLTDANLLKIQVTHAVPLNVPIAGKMLAQTLLLLDSNEDHRLYYLSGHFPLKSSATVRMQSEALEGSIISARDRPYGAVVAKLADIADDVESAIVDAIQNDGDSDNGDLASNCDANGLPVSTSEPETSTMSCPVLTDNVGTTDTC